MDDGSRGIEQSAKKQGVADENDLHVSKLSDGVDMVVGRVYALEVRFSDFFKKAKPPLPSLKTKEDYIQKRQEVYSKVNETVERW